MADRYHLYHGPCREVPCHERCTGAHGWCRNHRANRSRGRRPQHLAKTGRHPVNPSVPRYMGRRQHQPRPPPRRA